MLVSSRPRSTMKLANAWPTSLTRIFVCPCTTNNTCNGRVHSHMSEILLLVVSKRLITRATLDMLNGGKANIWLHTLKHDNLQTPMEAQSQPKFLKLRHAIKWMENYHNSLDFLHACFMQRKNASTRRCSKNQVSSSFCYTLYVEKVLSRIVLLYMQWQSEKNNLKHWNYFNLIQACATHHLSQRGLWPETLLRNEPRLTDRLELW